MFQTKVVNKIKTDNLCVCEIFEDSNATLIFGWAYYSENHKLRSCRQKPPLLRRADAQVYPCLSMEQDIALHYITPNQHYASLY